MKFSVMNLGCKVNAYESESIAAIMEERGHIRVDFNEPSDACMIFTCAVTNTAAQKSRQMMHRAKRKNPNAVIAVVGCYAQVDSDALDDADIIIGSSHKLNLPDYIEDAYNNHIKIRDVESIDALPFENMKLVEFEDKTRASLKIQDGCNQFCSYCIIPYARGRERSMHPDLVIKEVNKIAENHKEIVLAGIHTGRYGKEYGITLGDLIERILKETSVERLRISSIEVSELDDKLVHLIATEDRIANHLHIPLQAGCDETLKRMNRPYDTKAFYDKIRSIRKQLPNVSISTDLIVGFVQESDEDFKESIEFCKKCELSFMHVFPYSLRDGTRAEKMEGHIHPQVKKARAKEAGALSEYLYDNFKKQWIGKEVDVLVEREKDGFYEGYSSEYLPVYIKQECERKEMVKVKITEFKDHKLYAERSE